MFFCSDSDSDSGSDSDGFDVDVDVDVHYTKDKPYRPIRGRDDGNWERETKDRKKPKHHKNIKDFESVWKNSTIDLILLFERLNK